MSHQEGLLVSRLHAGKITSANYFSKVLPQHDPTRESQLPVLPGTSCILLNGHETFVLAPDTFSSFGWFRSSRGKRGKLLHWV